MRYSVAIIIYREMYMQNYLHQNHNLKHYSFQIFSACTRMLIIFFSKLFALFSMLAALLLQLVVFLLQLLVVLFFSVARFLASDAHFLSSAS